MRDVIVVGAGGAGLSAAIAAAERGAEVLVVAKTFPTQSQTCMAQGGINAVLKQNGDSINAHIEDTLKSGAGLAEPEIVKYVCEEAKNVIEWLDFIGTPFTRKKDEIAQRRLGGASKPRACYAQDFTGLKILHTLYDRALKLDIEFLTERFLLNVILDHNGETAGITVLNKTSGEVEQILGKCVVLATGGFAKVYGKFSTNSHQATGDGIGAALRAGCKISNMEFVQFHPTALYSSSVLISEAARGAGAKLINQKGERFVDELATRDEVARAIFKEMENGNEVFLDLTHLGEEFIEQNLPQERRLAVIYEKQDPIKTPLKIKPAAHYTMGGIDVDLRMRTSIKGLYAAGECADAKLHGANRLGGNSLLEVCALGRKAGLEAADEASAKEFPKNRQYEITKRDSAFIKALFTLPNKIDFVKKREFLGKILYSNAGVFRSESGLKGVLAELRQTQKELSFMGLKDRSLRYNTELFEFIEFGNMIEITEALLVGAINRTESRGSHFRVDFPDRNDRSFLAHSVIWKNDEGVICAEYRRVKEST